MSYLHVLNLWRETQKQQNYLKTAVNKYVFAWIASCCYILTNILKKNFALQTFFYQFHVQQLSLKKFAKLIDEMFTLLLCPDSFYIFSAHFLSWFYSKCKQLYQDYRRKKIRPFITTTSHRKIDNQNLQHIEIVLFTVQK